MVVTSIDRGEAVAVPPPLTAATAKTYVVFGERLTTCAAGEFPGKNIDWKGTPEPSRGKFADFSASVASLYVTLYPIMLAWRPGGYGHSSKTAVARICGVVHLVEDS